MARERSGLWRLVLGLVGAVATVLAASGTSHSAASPWSEWKPDRGGVMKVTAQIANRIAPTYRADSRGNQLVAVIPSGPYISNAGTRVAVRAIVVRRTPKSNAGIRTIADTSKTWLYVLCGLGQNCALTGTASVTRDRFIRRQALELALYTFTFVPNVDSLLLFLPPSRGGTQLRVMLLERSSLQPELTKPLRKTLPLTTPPLPSAENQIERATIDKLTLKSVFLYEYAALPTGGASITLDPAS